MNFSMMAFLLSFQIQSIFNYILTQEHRKCVDDINDEIIVSQVAKKPKHYARVAFLNHYKSKEDDLYTTLKTDAAKAYYEEIIKNITAGVNMPLVNNYCSNQIGETKITCTTQLSTHFTFPDNVVTRQEVLEWIYRNKIMDDFLAFEHFAIHYMQDVSKSFSVDDVNLKLPTKFCKFYLYGSY